MFLLSYIWPGVRPRPHFHVNKQQQGRCVTTAVAKPKRQKDSQLHLFITEYVLLQIEAQTAVLLSGTAFFRGLLAAYVLEPSLDSLVQITTMFSVPSRWYQEAEHIAQLQADVFLFLVISINTASDAISNIIRAYSKFTLVKDYLKNQFPEQEEEIAAAIHNLWAHADSVRKNSQ